MNKISKIISSSIVSNRRKIKFLGLGKSDVQEKNQLGPYGTDSAPIKGMVAVYASTGVIGDEVIVGYINENQISEPGEYRVFATDANGTVLIDIHLKQDGKIYLGGGIDNAVRYGPLAAGLSSQDTAINVELTKIAVAINAIVPGSYTPLTISTDVSSSKIDEIKTP